MPRFSRELVELKLHIKHGKKANQADSKAIYARNLVEDQGRDQMAYEL